jgi:DNA-binding MarR family transcriptional regulator
MEYLSWLIMSSIMSNLVDRVNQLGSLDPSRLPEQPLEHDVLELMHSIMHCVRGAQHREAETPASLGHIERKALGFFGRNPGATQSDLVSHSGRDKGQIARLVSGLKERELLEACPDADDRRVTRLYPTEKARSLHAEVQQERRALAVRAVAGFSAQEQTTLLRLLRQIEKNLQSAD